FLAYASDDKMVKIWEVETGKCIKTVEGHTSHMLCCTHNPQCAMIASESLQGIVRIWDQ
ncbi:hypothetical protein Angca_003598, partial [Angiostrongylus cantonensis]